VYVASVPLSEFSKLKLKDSRMPLVRKARRTEHDFETVKRTVADKCFFAGTGQHLTVFERLVLAFTTAAHSSWIALSNG